MSEENANTSSNQVSGANDTPVIQPNYPTTLNVIGTFVGREEIRTTYPEITPENIYEVLRKSISVFERNRGDIEYLYNYYLGLQPILGRTKLVRPDINNKIVVNHATEIVDFFTGYGFGDSIVYAGRAESDCSDEIQQLNEWNSYINLDAVNVELGTWMNLCGTSYKITLPNRRYTRGNRDGEAPFTVSALDPREAFVVYYNGVEKYPVMGVKVVKGNPENDLYNFLYCVYTKDRYYEIPNTMLYSTMPAPSRYNPIGEIPIVEYPLNLARRGRMEAVIPILDALNILASNRLDGVEQLIQSILLLRNVDLSGEDVKKLSQFGAIKYKDVDPSTPGEVRYITAELNQEGAQTLKDDLYNSMLIISGMPNRQMGATSTSDNVGSVIFRDGWSNAETKTKEMEKFYTRSERNLLRVILNIIREMQEFDVHLANIDVKFTRKNYENILTKAQVLTMMLSNEKIAPRLAYLYSGMFTDPDAAWTESEAYLASHPADTAGTEGESNGTQADTGTGSSNREDSQSG